MGRYKVRITPGKDRRIRIGNTILRSGDVFEATDDEIRPYRHMVECVHDTPPPASPTPATKPPKRSIAVDRAMHEPPTATVI